MVRLQSPVDSARYSDEAEVLLSANHGFEICSVDDDKKEIILKSCDESHCLREKTMKYCKYHQQCHHA